MAVAMTALGVSSASAHDKGGECRSVQIKHSEDGGKTWSTNGRIGSAPSAVTVKLTGNPTKGCAYDVSLASYETEGPTWETSGKQSFLDYQTTTLSKDTNQATLTLGKLPSCFGQIDLYANSTKYDGNNGNALPHFPDSYTPTNLITAWNGKIADKCDTTPPPGDTTGGDTTGGDTTGGSTTGGDTTGGDTTGGSTTGGDTTGGSTTGGDTTGGDTTGGPTDSPSPSASDTPPATSSPSPSASTPVVGDTAAPSGSPVAKPVSSTPTLAETGSDSSQTTAFVAAGAALVVIGGGAVVFTRRRRNTNAG